MIEYALNFAIYQQVTAVSDYYAGKSIEVWGKLIAGIGIALIASRFLCSKVIHNPYQARVFLFCCIFAIPFSFWLQNKILEKTIEFSNSRDHNKASLLLAVRSTITPSYSINSASYKIPVSVTARNDGKLNNLSYLFKPEQESVDPIYTENKQHYLALAEKCSVASNEQLGTSSSSGTSKIMWTLKNLKEPLNRQKEVFFETVIRDYYSCIYEDKTYRVNHLGKGINYAKTTARKEYDNYKDQSEKWRKAAFGRRPNKKRADKAWRAGVNKKFDVENSTLPPQLSYEEFLSHPDVMNYVKKIETPIGSSIFNELHKDDYDEGIANMMQKDILKFVAPLYISRNSVQHKINKYGFSAIDMDMEEPKKDADNITLGEWGSLMLMYQNKYGRRFGGPSEYNLSARRHNDMPIRIYNTDAYAALVMPLIGMGLSAFFLVLNIGLSLVNITPKPFKQVVGMLMIYFIFIHPLLEIRGDHELADNNYASKWLYYYEDKISVLHEVASDTVADTVINKIQGNYEAPDKLYDFDSYFSQ